MKFTTIENAKKVIRRLPGTRRAMQWQLGELTADELAAAVRRAVKRAPFYRDVRSAALAEPFDITRLPIIRKADIVGRERGLLATHIPPALLYHKKTGGSTGVSLHLYYSLRTLLHKDVLNDYVMSLIGKNLRVATLRGNAPRNNQVVETLADGNILLSSYMLSTDTLQQYIDALNTARIGVLMAYPSALVILARLIRARHTTAPLPHLKGIVTSSEVFDPESKLLVRHVFPQAKLIDVYGHNELAARAISVDLEPYRFFSRYGYVEFVPTGNILPNGNREAEIVATSIMNRSMPFVRYGTEDYVELDAQGRPVAVMGRSCDFVVNRIGETVPCIVLTRDRSLQNVINFQYFQPRAGHLVFRVVTNNRFTDADAQMIVEDMDKSFNGRMHCSVQQVADVERTPLGKQRRLVSALRQ